VKTGTKEKKANEKRRTQVDLMVQMGAGRVRKGRTAKITRTNKREVEETIMGEKAQVDNKVNLSDPERNQQAARHKGGHLGKRMACCIRSTINDLEKKT